MAAPAEFRVEIGTSVELAHEQAIYALASLLDEARKGGEIRIKRRDGTEFAVKPIRSRRSPLDVPGVETDVTAEDIVAAVRESREREPSRGSG